MMDQQNDKFEAWALVELFGHQRLAGRVTGGSDMTTDTLARLRELALAATPGPWVYHHAFAVDVRTKDGQLVAATWATDGSKRKDADGVYLAACDPQTIIRMCDVIAAADAMRREFFPDGIGLHQSGCKQCDSAHAYDAARKTLDER